MDLDEPTSGPQEPSKLARAEALLSRILPPVALCLGLVLVIVVAAHLGAGKKLNYVRQIVTIGLASLALVGWTRSWLTPKRQVLLGVLLTLFAGSAFWIQAAQQARHLGEDKQIYPWGVYHYYLGAKYFDELGYKHLYDQSLVADAEETKDLKGVPKIRDLSTYRFVKAKKRRKGKRLDTFSDERWSEFKADLAFMTGLKGTDFWKQVLRDRGYNPSPSWNAIGSALTNSLSIRDRTSQTLLVLLDVLLVLSAFAVSIRAYGWTRSMFILAAFYIWFGNPNRVFGQIYNLDWFAATWAAVACWRLVRARTAGALIGYATMVRIFPIVLLTAPIAHVGLRAIRGRPPATQHRRLLAGAVAGMVVMFALGTMGGNKGLTAWKMFGNNIVHHSSEHAYGSRRLGLQHLFGLSWSEGLEKKAVKKKNRANQEANKTLFRTIQLVLAALFLLAIIRSDDHDGLLLGAALVFVGTVASRYYGAIFILLMLLGCPARGDPGQSPPKPRPLPLRSLDAGLLAIVWAVYASPLKGSEDWATYVWANALLLAWFLALLAVRFTAHHRAVTA